MKLDSGSIDLIHQCLLDKGVKQACPACGHEKFRVLDMVLSSPSYRDKNDPVDREMRVPMVALSCRNCSHTRFFSAKKMGIA